MPIGIYALNQLDLLFSAPPLDLLFSADCAANIIVALEIHQATNMKVTSETLEHLGLVFPYPFPQFAGEACVQNPRRIRDDVNVITMVLQRRCPSTPLRYARGDRFSWQFLMAGTAMAT